MTAKPEIDPTSVASWAKTYRAAEGLTQRQLAAALKTSPGVIGALECGKIRSRRVARAVLALVVANPDDVI